jgi:uncharacterized coiled-coil protein SlyX
MTYGAVRKVNHLKSVVSSYQTNLEEMETKMSKQKTTLEEMQKQVENAQAELASSRQALSNVTNKFQTAIKQHDCARKKAHKTQEKPERAVEDSAFYEDELLAKCEDLTDTVLNLKSELSLP